VGSREFDLTGSHHSSIRAQFQIRSDLSFIILEFGFFFSFSFSCLRHVLRFSSLICDSFFILVNFVCLNSDM
jgi:hypothetical protein